MEAGQTKFDIGDKVSYKGVRQTEVGKVYAVRVLLQVNRRYEDYLIQFENKKYVSVAVENLEKYEKEIGSEVSGIVECESCVADTPVRSGRLL